VAKKSRILFSPRSLADLQRINEFYTHIDAKVRAQALARLLEGLQLIEKFPSIGRATSQSAVKELVIPFGKGNFCIRYREYKQYLHVAHLWHSLEDEL
jgi:plasmid stabilization system protein ParE